MAIEGKNREKGFEGCVNIDCSESDTEKTGKIVA